MGVSRRSVGVPSAVWRDGRSDGLEGAVPQMARRSLTWDYRGRGGYLVTLKVDDPQSRALGALEATDGPGTCPSVVPSDLGRRVAALLWQLGDEVPEFDVLDVQLMPNHVHGVVRVNRRLPHPIGVYLRRWRVAAAWAARERGVPVWMGDEHGRSLAAAGLSVCILDGAVAEARALAYMRANPQRAWERVREPGLYSAAREIAVPLALGDRDGFARFCAVGDVHLLDRPHVLQVQCARSDFVWTALERSVSTVAFEIQCTRLLAAAAQGAVLVSPCLTPGEQEIARRALLAGASVVLLQAGGSPLSGLDTVDLSAACADGRLLQLVPSGWTARTRPLAKGDACVLARLALLLADTGCVGCGDLPLHPGVIDRRLVRAVRFTAGRVRGAAQSAAAQVRRTVRASVCASVQ